MGLRESIGASLVAVISSGASATVIGLDVEFNGLIGGRYVWSVYAVSSNPNNVLLNVIGHHVVSGSMASIEHNDFGGGSWDPIVTILPGQVSNDSFVTITGLPGSGTNLDPSFGTGVGSAIPNGAGWFTSNPGSDILFTGGRVKIMQLAGQSLNGAQWLGRLTVGYKASSSSTTPLYAENLFYGVPSPGALTVLAAAGRLRRRRQQ
jgi:hypothetical protein